MRAKNIKRQDKTEHDFKSTVMQIDVRVNGGITVGIGNDRTGKQKLV